MKDFSLVTVGNKLRFPVATVCDPSGKDLLSDITGPALEIELQVH